MTTGRRDLGVCVSTPETQSSDGHCSPNAAQIGQVVDGSNVGTNSGSSSGGKEKNSSEEKEGFVESQSPSPKEEATPEQLEGEGELVDFLLILVRCSVYARWVVARETLATSL